MAELAFVHPPPPPPPQPSGSGEMEEAPEYTMQQLRDIIRGLQHQKKKSEVSVQQIRDIVRDLQHQRKKYINLLHQREELELYQGKDPELDPGPFQFHITKDMVIDFIKEVDYADRYWDMKKYLTDLSVYSTFKDWETNLYLKGLPIVYTEGPVFDEYLKDLDKSSTKFDIDEEDVWRCVFCHIKDLETKLFTKRPTKEIPETCGDKKTSTVEEKFESSDRYAHYHPVWKLVLQARENEYVMNTNPLLELQNLKDCVLLCTFMRHHIGGGPRIDPERTVMVPNVSPRTNQFDVRQLLSKCGEVDFCDSESARGKPKTVFVTFKDPQGAKAALEMESLEVGGRAVKIKTPQPACVPRKWKDVGDDPALEEAFGKYSRHLDVGDPALEEAFGKYNWLLEKFRQLSNEVKDAKKKGRPSQKHKRSGASRKKVNGG